jgi:hypothetical protein
MREKRRSGRRSAPRTRGPEPAPPAQKQRAFLGVIAAVLLLGGAGAGVTLWRRTRPAVAPVAPPATARDPAAGMSTIEAATMAARLYREDRAYESLPYYRRVAPEMAPGRLDFRLEFATALEHASLQARIRSEERVGLMLESLDELARVERAVQGPRARARVIVARAFFLRVWGFPADAVAELRRAIATDPSYPDLSATVRLMERRVREPTLPVDALEGPGLGH